MSRNREHQWAITLIRQRGKFLSYVTAPDQATAIQEAIKHFEIKDPEQQRRLVAQLQECVSTLLRNPNDVLQRPVDEWLLNRGLVAHEVPRR